MKTSCVLLLAALCCYSAASPATKDLYKHTFSPKSALQMMTGSSNIDGTLPRTITPTATQKANCRGSLDNGATYNGIRGNQVDGTNNNYVYSLYDVNGKIVGMQVATPKSQVDTVGFEYQYVPSFQEETINGVVYKIMTVYFIADTSVICTTGRTDFETAGTASALRLQNGIDASHLIVAPNNRADAIASGQYSDNKCFPGMGDHTFSNVESWQTYNCKRIIPLFILQDKEGVFSGFGLAWTGFSNSSKEVFEHPPEKVISIILGNAPDCVLALARDQKLTTLHVLFNSSPYNCGYSFDDVKQKFQDAIDKFVNSVRDGLRSIACAIWRSCDS